MRRFSLAALCFLFGSLSADQTGERHPVKSVEEKLKKLEEDSGVLSLKETTTLILFGDFIYWKPSLDGVAWATTAKAVPLVGGGTTFNNFKTRTAHFDYSPGFKIGIGVGVPYDHWDVQATWLRIYSHGNDRARGSLTTAVGNRVIFDNDGLIEGLIVPPNKASARCDVHLNVVDGVLGRTFLWSRYFVFRPFAGIRGAWLKVDWDISFTRPITTPVSFDQDQTDFDVNNHYNAGGLVGGFESKWNIYKEFGVFSYASASLLYGKSEEKTHQEYFLTPALQSDTFKQTFKAKNSTHAVKGAFDIAAGFKWETDMFKKTHFLILAGWDFFYWPSVAQKTIFQNSRTREREDLSYQGLILGARLDY